jgi:hypothetical protein
VRNKGEEHMTTVMLAIFTILTAGVLMGAGLLMLAAAAYVFWLVLTPDD